jgi:hypothetical protein
MAKDIYKILQNEVDDFSILVSYIIVICILIKSMKQDGTFLSLVDHEFKNV